MEKQIRDILAFIGDRYCQEDYPSLLQQWREWSVARPLAGLSLLDATPCFTNTLLKYVPLLAAGAAVTVGISDRIPYDHALVSRLRQWGVHVKDDGMAEAFDCVLDCGGAFSTMPVSYGYVELTRSGYYHYGQCRRPVILVDDSRIKSIETCLGTGDGFLRGMASLGYQDWHGRVLVVFGFGKVGRGVAYYCQREGAKIFAVDNAGTNVPEGVTLVDRTDREAVRQVCREAYCVVTATGIAGAMRGNGAAEVLRHGSQLVAAIGIEDEWQGELPAERLLVNGQTVNFLLDEPTHLRYIEATMALSNAAVLELYEKKLPAGIQKISPDVEAHYWDILEKQSRIADELKAMPWLLTNYDGA